MAWAALFVAGLLEVVWAYFMKRSDGFTHLGASIATLGFMAASIGLLAMAMKSLPLGTAYMVWTGVGAVGTFLVGWAAMGEAVSPPRLAAAVLIVAGLVLMRLTSPA